MSGGQASITSLGCPGHTVTARGLKGNREWPPSCMGGYVCVFILMQYFASQIVPWAIYVFSGLKRGTFKCYASLKKKNHPLISAPLRALFMSLFTNGSINLLPNPWLVNGPSKKLSVAAEVCFLGDIGVQSSVCAAGTAMGTGLCIPAMVRLQNPLGFPVLLCYR